MRQWGIPRLRYFIASPPCVPRHKDGGPTCTSFGENVWLRSPNVDDDNNFMNINDDGDWNNDNANNENGVVLGFSQRLALPVTFGRWLGA